MRIRLISPPILAALLGLAASDAHAHIGDEIYPFYELLDEDLDRIDPTDGVEARIRALYPMLQDVTGETSLAYLAVSVPTAYRLDPAGTVTAAARGAGPVLALIRELAREVREDCDSCP